MEFLFYAIQFIPDALTSIQKNQYHKYKLETCSVRFLIRVSFQQGYELRFQCHDIKWEGGLNSNNLELQFKIFIGFTLTC